MITVVIPVYNEAATIRQIVTTLLTGKEKFSIIVIDDGSTDKTAETLRDLSIVLLKHQFNLGKDRAVLTGVKAVLTDKVLLLDGDLVGLNSEHINKIISFADNFRMVLGILKPRHWWHWLFFLNRYFISRTGIRLVNRDDILSLPSEKLGQFRLESVLASLSYQNKWPVKKVILSRIRHYSKEKKYGWKFGLIRRYQMLRDIFKFYVGKYTIN